MHLRSAGLRPCGGAARCALVGQAGRLSELSGLAGLGLPSKTKRLLIPELFLRPTRMYQQMPKGDIPL
jgi:hypothetical protein